MATLYVSSTGSNTSPYDTWGKAATALTTAVTAATAGDTILLDSAETQTVTAATHYAFANGVQLISANRTSSVQEIGAIIDFSTTASTAELRTSSGAISGAMPYIYGVKFKLGKSGVTHSFRALGLFESCTVERLATATLNCDLGAVWKKSTFLNASGVTSGINSANGTGGITHQECIFFPTGGVPSSVFGSHSGIVAIGCDFSTCTVIYANTNASAYLRFENCKLHPSFVYTAQAYNSNPVLEYLSCSSGDNVISYAKIAQAGIINHTTGVYLASGGVTFSDQDGSSVPLSLMCVSSSAARKHVPLYSPWINVHIASTGSKTFSTKIAHTSAGALNDNDVWLEVEYYGDSTTPKSSIDISAPVISGTTSIDTIAVGSALTDTAEAWTGITSEITHTLSKTVTVSQQGFARVRVALGLASTTIYVDPQVVVS
jgi:hypothetical protein